mgnify:CR=1 FL=1|tara:strand:+ start:231 stop:419 length:189 start_codon:yes stop_codon:yes gene_type:complete
MAVIRNKKKRRKEIIKNLTHTINSENEKPNGGNVELVVKLQKRLDSILDGTFVSKFRKPKVK